MMASPLARDHVLLWGSAQPVRIEGRASVDPLPSIHRAPRVGRVFRAARGEPITDEANRRITAALEAARIPIVLLDGGLAAYPGPTTTISSGSTTVVRGL